MSAVLPARLSTVKLKTRPSAPVIQPVAAKVAPTKPAAIGGVSSARSVGSDAPGYAQVIENGFPTQTGIRPRGGARRQATTGTRAVQSMMAYQGGALKSLWAVANGGIFDVTSPASPTSTLTATVTGKTNSFYVSANFATVGGNYMLGVNGSDLHMVFDGTTWAANSPAITGKTSDNFNFVWAYASRLWFIQKNSLSVWYLPTDSIGGAVTELSLKGIFPKGGSLVFGATWSNDTGGGLSEKIVFVTSEGEVAVYQGVDPSSSATWSRVGTYGIGKPLGRKSFTNIGGDLIVETVDGIVTLSLAATKDPGSLSISAVTKEVNPAWKSLAASYRNQEWSLVKWPEKNMLLAAYAGTFTTTGGTTDVIDNPGTAYPANLETGAWASSYTGWDVQCSQYFNGKVYFGSANGRVYEAESGGSDDGTAYIFKYLEWPDDFGDPGVKQFLQCRTTFTYSQPFIAQVTISTDYMVQWPTAPSAAANSTTGGFWDLGGFWDTGGTWDATLARTVEHQWRSLGRTGYEGAIQIQMTFNNTTAPDVEIVSNTVTYRPGAVVA